MPIADHPEDHGVACVLCGGRRFRLRHAWASGDRWNQCGMALAVWDCRACRLTMLFPVPQSLPGPAGGGAAPAPPVIPDWFERRDISRQYWFKRAKARLVARLFGSRPQRFLKMARRIRPAGRLLDVGAGEGAFLAAAARHYDCVGVEPSAIAAAACARRGLTVVQATFEAAELPEASFDIITMDSVIEHVRDPVAVLAKSRRLLKPGGVIGLNTPNLAGPSYLARRAGWNGFRVGWHTFLFTGGTLRACMRKAGLEVVPWPRRDWPLLDDGLILWGRRPRADGDPAHKAPAR